MLMQTCLNCNKPKNLSAFEKLDSGNLRKTCRTCRNNQKIVNAENKKKEILKLKATIKVKTCSKCENLKDIKEFNELIRSKDGYNKMCKKCYKLSRKPKNNNKVLNETLNKTCSVCSYVGNNFKKCSKSLDGYFHQCNNCWKPIEWNKEKQKVAEKKYCENNKEKLREKWRKQGKNINRRIRDSLNKRIKSCLFSKNNKTFEYTGCDNNFLKKWFEHNFSKKCLGKIMVSGILII